MLPNTPMPLRPSARQVDAKVWIVLWGLLLLGARLS